MSHEHDHAGGGVHKEMKVTVKGMHCGDCEAKVVTAVSSVHCGALMHDVRTWERISNPGLALPHSAAHEARFRLPA